MRLLIRADASIEIGTGHVMRCLALAQAAQEKGFSVLFVSHASLPSALQARLGEEGMKVILLPVPIGSGADASDTLKTATDWQANWLILDGYKFDADYQQYFGNQTLSVLLLDDYGHADFYSVDFILNQNISAQTDWYQRRSPQTQLLLGTNYSLLRREFRQWKYQPDQQSPSVPTVLVTLGGADPDNLTGTVLQALQKVETPLRVHVVLGGSNPHYDKISKLVAGSLHEICLLRDVKSMPTLMAEADISISAGGSTCWELAFMGVPGIVLVLADNQRAIAEGLHEYGAFINLGWHEVINEEAIAQALTHLIIHPEKRKAMSHRGKQLVDGLGAFRVLQAIAGKTSGCSKV